MHIIRGNGKLTRTDEFKKVLSYNLGNFFLSQSFRDKRATEIVEVLEEALRNVDKHSLIADFGAGSGEIAAEIIMRKKCTVYCIDPYVQASAEVEAKADDKIIWIETDALKTAIAPRYPQIALSCYFLQTLDGDGKIAALKEMKRIARDEIIVIDEVPHGALSLIDTAIHYGLNVLGKGGYEIYNEEEWIELFRKAGLEVAGKTKKFGRNNVVFVLKRMD